MKRRTVLLLSAMMTMMPATAALAEDLEVQLIGGGDTAVGAASLDDAQLGETYEIDGFAKIAPLSFEFIDYFSQYDSGMNGVNDVNTRNDDTGARVRYGNPYANIPYYDNINWVRSGENAEYAWFLVDITNKQKEAVNFMDEEMTQVKVVYDDEYEYAGWIRQFNYDYDTESVAEDEVYGTKVRAAIQPDSAEPVDMMYTGHYAFGCTLPNEVVNGKESLYMVITIGDSEITYNIRK